MSAESPFKCVECGSEHCAEEMQVGVKYAGENPWAYIAAREVCYSCKSVQPRALARRWNNESFDEARQVWHERYRQLAPRYL